MGIVYESVEYSVGQGGITDCFVPLIYGKLTGDDCGPPSLPVFEDFQQVAALNSGQY